MADPQLIARIFKDRGIEIAGPVIKDRETSSHLVFVPVESGQDRKQTPTNYAISQAEKAAEAVHGEITVVIIQRGNEDVASSIKSLILRRFSDDIRNVFSSVRGNAVSVWVEPKSATTIEKSLEVEQAVKGLVGHLGIELESFINTAEMNLPSETACINIIRKQAPTSFDAIKTELGGRGFEVPGDDWLRKLLDRWRRNQLIHRRRDGTYVMTHRGLQALGSGKTGWSPDVARALDMARRRD